ncbi:MAG TPA: hypothetical protein VHR72_08545 [Gemmataceae bacterium]|nr:hypothetical protein [Gemmataceae bacterium]
MAAGLFLTGWSAAQEPVSNDLKDLPTFREFRSDPFIAAAIKLQAAGKKDGMKRLLELAKSPRGGTGAIVLCRMLFTAKPMKGFRRPGLGEPLFLGAFTYSGWQLEPIEIVDGVPFWIVGGYELGGLPEAPESYAKYCIDNCAWQETKFEKRSAAQKRAAFEKLIDRPKLRLTFDEMKILRSQIN